MCRYVCMNESETPGIESNGARDAAFDETLAERDQRIANLAQALAERGARLARLEEEHAAVVRSTSWRITAPLRACRRRLSALLAYLRAPTWRVLTERIDAQRLALIAQARKYYRGGSSRYRAVRVLRRIAFRMGLVRDRDLRRIDNHSPALSGYFAGAGDIVDPSPACDDGTVRRRYTPPAGLLPWFNPLNVVIDPALERHPKINVVIPGLGLKHLSGGPNTAIALAILLAERGLAIRLVASDAPLDRDLASLWRHIESMLDLTARPENVEIVDASDRSRPWHIGRNDVFCATAWWTAQMVKYATNHTDHKKFIYLIQDFEPLLHAASSSYALALETYSLDFIPVVNMRLLFDYFAENRIGRFSDPAFRAGTLVFEPAVDVSRFFPEPKGSGGVSRASPLPHTLLFYARPTNGLRNLFEIGVAALQKAIADEVLDPTRWKFYGMGEKFEPVNLGKGAVLKPLPWFTLEQYAATMRRSDVLLSLMLSPHPSYPPLEMAACGNLVVTNRFGTKTPERLAAISRNILAAEPTIESIVLKLSEAVDKLGSNRDFLPKLPRSWRESLAATASTLATWVAEFHEGAVDYAQARDYAEIRESLLESRRRATVTEQIPGLLSFITTAWNTPPQFLDQLAESLFCQDGGTDFEWIILDNGSTAADTRECLQRIGRHRCAKLYRTERNLGIVGGLRFCLEKATGRYVLPLDSDDYLYPDGVRVLTRHIVEQRYPKVLYTDEDKLSRDRFQDPYFKPDWDPVLFLDSCYIAHLCAIDRQTGLELGIYSDARAEGSHDGDTFMRFMLAGYAPAHVPEVLYSWRMHEQSTSSHIDSKPYVYDSQKFVLSRFISSARDPDRYELVPSPLFNRTPDWWIRRKQRDPRPMLSVVYGMEEKVERHRFEPPEKHRPWRRVQHVEAARGIEGLLEAIRAAGPEIELVHLLWNQVEPTDLDWVWECFGLFELFPDTVVVGGMIHDGAKVLSGPLVFGFGRGCDCPDRGRPMGDPGYFAQMWKHRTVSAVSAAHCVVDRRFFENVAHHLVGQQVSVALLGAWLGALARRQAKRVVFSPFLRARSGAALEDRARPGEIATFRTLFSDLIPEPSYLSPHLGLLARTAYQPVTPAQRAAELRVQRSIVPDYETWISGEIGVRKARYPVSEPVPKLCVLTSIYEETPPELFEELIQSLLAQSLPFSCWVIVINGPVKAALAERIRVLESEPRIRLVREPENRAITHALRNALQHAEGDYVLPIDADDTLTEDAFQVMAHELLRLDFPALAYSDEDLLIDGRLMAPYLRPDFDPILCLESSYVWHLVAIRRDVALELGLYGDDGAAWCHDWDSLLRVADAGHRIVHVPEVLYHWRRHTASTSNRQTVNPKSLASVRHVLNGRIARQSVPECFEVADFPLDRGLPELYIQRRRTRAPRAGVVLFGSDQGDIDAAALEQWRQLDPSVVAVYADPTRPLRPLLSEILAQSTEFLICAHHALGVNHDVVFWEAVRLFALHTGLQAIGGLVEADAGTIVDGCRVWDRHGGLVSPWLGMKSGDPGPYALALKAHRVATPSGLIAAFRAKAVTDFLSRSDAPQSMAELVLSLGNHLAARNDLVAFSPLLRGVLHAPVAVPARPTNAGAQSAGGHTPLMGAAGFWNARSLFK